MAHMSIDMMVCVGTMEFSGHICVFFLVVAQFYLTFGSDPVFFVGGTYWDDGT